ncbi:SGNH/GDSL hydrolase family protein [Bacillus tuaregi]|uniref:SGNH/GDSL hydrolase family protein n=1 Tax=Bacillus tuaregi TaxID=1816695 RepID=UPI000A037864|nr:SGNH/GDSL hydrolase family protein [Bacillus tuaregi]
MHKHKVIIILASLLFGSLLLVLFFSNIAQVKQANSTIEASTKEKIMVAAEENDSEITISSYATDKKEEQLDTDTLISLAEEEGQEEADHDSSKQTFTEGIKDKIREVIQGTIRLFKKDLKVVAIGDSLTQGVGDETGNGGFVGILKHSFEDNQLNISIENYGKRGNRTDQLLKRLDNKEIASSIEKADTVIITIGANDIMKVVKSHLTNLTLEPFEKEREEYIERLRDIFQKINDLNPEVQIYLVGFYNPFEQFFGDIEEFRMISDSWNEAGRFVTEEFHNVEYIPVADLFDESNKELLAEDFFHPNTSGYKLIAERVLENLNEVIREETNSTEETD